MAGVPLGQRTKFESTGTARRILDYARQAFNQRGVAAVGMREIARGLDLSPGNVSYHFPTKQALVSTLIREVHAANNAAVNPPTGLRGFNQVDAVIRTIMRRDLENRWLLRDYVGLLAAMPTLRELNDQTQAARDARVDAVVAQLVAAGLLDRERVERRLPLLRRQVITQVFFWLPAAILSAPDRDPQERLDLHARATMALFAPYCTPAGKRQLDALLDQPAPRRRKARVSASIGHRTEKAKRHAKGRRQVR